MGSSQRLTIFSRKEKQGNVEKLITSIEDKEKYVIHISALKQAFNHGLKLKKVHSVIEFRQEAWPKPYIDMNTKLRTEAKNDFENDFFKLMNNSDFGKTMENIRNQRDIKPVTTNERRNELVFEPNYHTTKYFSENLLAIEMRKTKIIMNKPAKLCYIDTDSFIIHIETEDFYEYIANDVDRWFDISGYDENDKRPLPVCKNKKVSGFFKDELNEKIMEKLCGPRPKTYAFRIDDDNNTEKKKAKGTKKCVRKRRLKFTDFYDSVFKNETILRSQHRFKCDHHIVYTEQVNKIAISSYDDKRIQTHDKVTTYPHETSVFKVCASEQIALKNYLKDE